MAVFSVGTGRPHATPNKSLRGSDEGLELRSIKRQRHKCAVKSVLLGDQGERILAVEPTHVEHIAAFAGAELFPRAYEKAARCVINKQSRKCCFARAPSNKYRVTPASAKSSSKGHEYTASASQRPPSPCAQPAGSRDGLDRPPSAPRVRRCSVRNTPPRARGSSHSPPTDRPLARDPSRHRACARHRPEKSADLRTGESRPRRQRACRLSGRKTFSPRV